MDLFLSNERTNKIDYVVENRLPGVALVLEDIHDPHNAAAIFRTCDAFGIQDVYLVFSREQPYNPNEFGRRTASSAHKWLTFHQFFSTGDAINALKSEEYTLFVSSLGKKAMSFYTPAYTEKKVALVVGNEHSGVSSSFLKAANHIVAIPMYGMVQSLNVSVASALLIAEITKKRRSNETLSHRQKGAQEELKGTFSKLASSVYTRIVQSSTKGGI